MGKGSGRPSQLDSLIQPRGSSIAREVAAPKEPPRREGKGKYLFILLLFLVFGAIVFIRMHGGIMTFSKADTQAAGKITAEAEPAAKEPAGNAKNRVNQTEKKEMGVQVILHPDKGPVNFGTSLEFLTPDR